MLGSKEEEKDREKRTLAVTFFWLWWFFDPHVVGLFFKFPLLLQGSMGPPKPRPAAAAGSPPRVGRFMLSSGLSLHKPFSLESMHVCAWIEK